MHNDPRQHPAGEGRYVLTVSNFALSEQMASALISEQLVLSSFVRWIGET